jgi:phosphate/sulfate permease
MSSSDLERVRSDLSTVRNALGLDLPWSTADARFCGAISVASGLYALLSWPNSPLRVPSWWAATPLFGVLAAFFIYMAVKQRSLPPRDESRRREYRSTLAALVVTLPAVAVYLVWGKYAGLTGTLLGGNLLALIGFAMLVIGIAQPPLRYPRSYLIVGSLPLIAFGLAIPLALQPFQRPLIGLLGFVELGVAALIVDRHVRRMAHAAEGETNDGH